MLHQHQHITRLADMKDYSRNDGGSLTVLKMLYNNCNVFGLLAL